MTNDLQRTLSVVKQDVSGVACATSVQSNHLQHSDTWKPVSVVVTMSASKHRAKVWYTYVGLRIA